MGNFMAWVMSRNGPNPRLPLKPSLRRGNRSRNNSLLKFRFDKTDDYQYIHACPTPTERRGFRNCLDFLCNFWALDMPPWMHWISFSQLTFWNIENKSLDCFCAFNLSRSKDSRIEFSRRLNTDYSNIYELPLVAIAKEKWSLWSLIVVFWSHSDPLF